MRHLFATFAILVAAVTVATVAAAGPDTAKQRVVITMKALPDGKFVLEPVQAGAVQPDSGTTRVFWNDPRAVTRDGQKIDVYSGVVWALSGKRGTLKLKERSEWIQTGNALIATGTWKVVGGTGAYAQITGHGRSAHVGHNQGQGAWYASHSGLLSSK